MEDNNIVNVAGNETVEEVTDLPKGSAGTDEAVGSEPISDAPGKETAVVKKVKERIKRDAAQIARKKRNEELIKKLLAENKELEKSVKSNRNKARNKYGMMIYAAVYSILGLTAKEKACQTEDDFAELKTAIEEQLKQNKSDSESIDPIRYESLTILVNTIIKKIGLPYDSLEKCKTKDDYRDLYKIVINRIKQLLADSEK